MVLERNSTTDKCIAELNHGDVNVKIINLLQYQTTYFGYLKTAFQRITEYQEALSKNKA